MKLLLWALICCCSLSGCATMFTDRTQKVSFKTEPPGAKVTAGFANNKKSCITPCTIDVDRNGDHILVSIAKKGYNTEEIPLMPRIEPWIFANVANFGIGGIIDMVNGRLMRFDPEQVVTLTPVSASEPSSGGARSLLQEVVPRPTRSEEVKTPAVKVSAKIPEDKETGSSIMVMTVTSSSAKLRKTPSKQAGVIKTLKRGETVNCLKQRDDWLMVELPGGEVGWCHKSLLGKN